MSPRPSEELLSAYLDNEVSPGERAEIERWLTGSPEAQRELDEFRQLSGLIRTLPAANVPPEFAAEVMQRAERRMLLPEPVPARRARRRGPWMVTVGGSLAAAALVVVMIDWAGRAPRPGGGAESDAPGFKRRPSVSDGSELVQSTPDDAREKAAKAGAPRLAPGNRTAAAPAPAAKRGADPKESGHGGVVRLHNEPGEVVEVQGEPDLDDSEVGRAIREILRRNADGEIPVLRIYVVDEVPGMQFVQYVLDKNEIPLDPRVADARLKKSPDNAAAEGPKNDVPTSPREALFVVADSHRLATALHAALANGDNAKVRSLTVRESLELAQLDGPSRERLERIFNSRPGKAGSPEAKDEAPGAERRDTPPPAAPAGREKRKSAKQSAEPPAPSSSAVSGAADEAASLHSRQVLVTLASAPEKSKAAADKSKDEPAPAASETDGRDPVADSSDKKSVGGRRNPAPADGRAAISADESPYVRVVIVIERGTGAAPTPAKSTDDGDGAA